MEAIREGVDGRIAKLAIDADPSGGDYWTPNLTLFFLAMTRSLSALP